jgi:biotin synthase
MGGVEQILTNAVEGHAPTREECLSLLSLPEHSLEAAIVTATADVVSRRRFGNRAMLLGQIGIEIAPCPGNCKFCTFGEDHTTFARARLTLEEILARAHAFADAGDLYALFLMTMHDFEFSSLLATVETVRKAIPGHTQIVVNIGDFDAVQAQELRAAGVSGAYHVCRLREGADTSLDPAQRRKTFGVIRDAGLDFYYCCEPIGPEHSPAELVEQLFLGIEFGCFQVASQ